MSYVKKGCVLTLLLCLVCLLVVVVFNVHTCLRIFECVVNIAAW